MDIPAVSSPLRASSENWVDSHVHIFAPHTEPMRADTPYVPHPSQMGTAVNLRAVLDAHGLTHALLIAAQPYGRDNSWMLRAIAQSGGRFKGIALVDPLISDRDLTALQDGGVVGLRINLSTFGLRELQDPNAERLFARAREMGWLMQIHLEKDELLEGAPLLRKSGMRLMFDHIGRPDVAKGTGQKGFQELLRFGRDDDAIIKLSGPFRSSIAGAPYGDVDPFIAACVDAFTLDRCVWGSDWPFTNVTERVDYAPQLQALHRWLPERADRRKVAWENSARLFGFQAVAAPATRP